MANPTSAGAALSTQDIVAAIVRRIDEGHYPVGSLLPSEADLQAQFGATRYRLREAMGALRKLGVIDSRAGIGTTVLARNPTPFFVHSQQTLDSIMEAARTTKLKLERSGHLRADAQLAGLLRVAPDSDWFFMDTLRYLRNESRPIGALWLYTRPEFAAVAESLEDWNGPVFKLLEQRFGVRVAVVDQEIDAAPLEAQLADRLGAEAGSPCLQVTRHWLDAAGKLVQCSVGIYPQGRSRYRSRLPLAGH